MQIISLRKDFHTSGFSDVSSLRAFQFYRSPVEDGIELCAVWLLQSAIAKLSVWVCLGLSVLCLFGTSRRGDTVCSGLLSPQGMKNHRCR